MPDGLLARHVAHLFIRDPLVVFEGSIEEVEDTRSTLHFEGIQSTNKDSYGQSQLTGLLKITSASFTSSFCHGPCARTCACTASALFAFGRNTDVCLH